MKNNNNDKKISKKDMQKNTDNNKHGRMLYNTQTQVE